MNVVEGIQHCVRIDITGLNWHRSLVWEKNVEPMSRSQVWAWIMDNGVELPMFLSHDVAVALCHRDTPENVTAMLLAIQAGDPERTKAIWEAR